MTMQPIELTLDIQPRSRYDAIDVAGLVEHEHGGILDDYEHVVYCSHHTTAGYLDQRLAARLEDRRERFDPFFRAFQGLFPWDAGYRHDDMSLRRELTEEQRRIEPKNADAHLTFIGSGLQSCVTYRHRPGVPVFFLDLDGVCEGRRRNRRTSLLAYSEEEPVAEFTIDIPVSRHAIDSVRLSDPHVGLMARIGEALGRTPIELGRIDLWLDPGEASAAVTVNEFETLLMRHDLADVLQDPLKFMAQQGRRILRDPRAVPAKSLGYAKYDAVRVINQLIDALGLGESAVERLVARMMAFPANRLLRLKRSLSMAVAGGDGEAARIVHGRFQSPILIQWKASPRRVRTLRVSLKRFR